MYLIPTFTYRVQFKQTTLTTTLTGPSWSLYSLSDTHSTNAIINALTA